MTILGIRFAKHGLIISKKYININILILGLGFLFLISPAVSTVGVFVYANTYTNKLSNLQIFVLK